MTTRGLVSITFHRVIYFLECDVHEKWQSSCLSLCVLDCGVTYCVV